MAENLEFGLDTFGDITMGSDGQLLSHAQVIRNVIEEAVLADEIGVDCFGIGEHHRPDFAVSSPEIVLAAIAGRTKRIYLGSRPGSGWEEAQNPLSAPPATTCP